MRIDDDNVARIGVLDDVNRMDTCVLRLANMSQEQLKVKLVLKPQARYLWLGVGVTHCDRDENGYMFGVSVCGVAKSNHHLAWAALVDRLLAKLSLQSHEDVRADVTRYLGASPHMRAQLIQLVVVAKRAVTRRYRGFVYSRAAFNQLALAC